MGIRRQILIFFNRYFLMYLVIKWIEKSKVEIFKSDFQVQVIGWIELLNMEQLGVGNTKKSFGYINLKYKRELGLEIRGG